MNVNLPKKDLPDFFTFEGKIFYYLSKNRYIGVTTKKIAKEFKLTILELLSILVSLYEKGLITLLQPGKTIAEDIWDIATDIRKKDPDINKIINATNYLEKELKKRLDELKEIRETKELKRMKDMFELEEIKDLKKTKE